jgi:multiple antibiotic resistance protein
MKDLIGQCLTVFMGLFAIMNPIANAPIFLSLTADDSPDIRRRIAGQALLLSFVLIVVFVLAGRLIFSLFGITLPAFQIVGGVLVALIGHHMLQGRQSPVQHLAEPHNTTPASSAALGIAVTPLAMPILAGPGTIATAMNFASTGHMREMLVTIAAFAVLCGITYAAFLSGERLVRFLGPNGLSVVTRLMGLMLAVIGVQMLITGIAGAIKANWG